MHLRDLVGLLAALSLIFGQVESYCQPDESCWPTQDEIDAFQASLTTSNKFKHYSIVF